MKITNELNKEVIKKSKKLRDQIFEDKSIEINNLVIDDDYSEIVDRCCENIIGYKKVPMGVSHRAVRINKSTFYIPICTTEGALVASMCRGIKLINLCDGLKGYVENLGITRSFCMEFVDFEQAMEFYKWLRNEDNICILKNEGELYSRFCKIKSISSKNVFGNLVYIKVTAYTGEAMGMNMISKACNQISQKIEKIFVGSRLNCISANICTDKKWSVENYCNGRGRKVFLNLNVKEVDLFSVMKVNIDEVLSVYHSKIVIGSSLVLGGFNCQAANYVAAIYLSLGQDLGHVIESSNCIISMKRIGNDILNINLVMPSLVLGTVGGGTHLEPGKSFFKQFDGIDEEFVLENEKDNSKRSNHLALLVASAVLAGEISCISSLANNTLVEAHMNLNRGKSKEK